jgi:Asp-tRNA(Asn)/Glu-tRNA(Gln) amidotransferase A subunit family amidase
MDATELYYTPATRLAAAIRAKETSPVEVTEAVLARIERLNPTLNAYCTVTAELARTTARAAEAAVMRGEALGLLHGVPLLAQGSDAHQGHPYHLRIEDF